MKTRPTPPSPTTVPLFAWEQEPQHNKTVEDIAHFKRLTVEKFGADPTWIVTDTPATWSEREEHLSVEEQLQQFNHFDLPFGFQQPTAAQLNILTALVHALFLPETPMATVAMFLRQMYNRFSPTVMPKLMREENGDLERLFGQWQISFAWLKDFHGESWWAIAMEFYRLGHVKEALLAHCQAMPTIIDLERTVKELGNYETTSDGRWIPASVHTAAQDVKRADLGVYGSTICAKPTTRLLSSACFHVSAHPVIVGKTKAVERFLCTLLMVYRHTHAWDVVKNLAHSARNVYSDNPEFDLVPTPIAELVLAHHSQRAPSCVVFDTLDAPLASPIVQEAWQQLCASTLSSLVLLNSPNPLFNGQGYCINTQNSHLRWLCFSRQSAVPLLSSPMFPTPLPDTNALAEFANSPQT